MAEMGNATMAHANITSFPARPLFACLCLSPMDPLPCNTNEPSVLPWRWKLFRHAACVGTILVCLQGAALTVQPRSNDDSLPDRAERLYSNTLHSPHVPRNARRHILLNVGLPRTGATALADFGICQGWEDVRSNQEGDCTVASAEPDTVSDKSNHNKSTPTLQEYKDHGHPHPYTYPSCGHCIAHQWQQGNSWWNCLAKSIPSNPRNHLIGRRTALTQIHVQSTQPYSWFLPQYGALEALATPQDPNDHLVWVLLLRSNATAWATSVLHWHSVTQRLFHALDISDLHGTNRNASVELPQHVTHEQVVASLQDSLSRIHTDADAVWEYRRQHLELAYTAHTNRVRQTAQKYGVSLVEIALDDPPDTEAVNVWAAALQRHGWPTTQPHCWKGPTVAEQLDTDWQDFTSSLF